METIRLIFIIVAGINAVLPFIFKKGDFRLGNTLGWVCAIIYALF